MPARYEAIRDSYVRRGKPYDKAQEIAARTFYRLTGKAVNAAHGKRGEKKK